MKKLILLLGLLYGCSKDNTTTPTVPAPTQTSTGDSVSIILNFKYSSPSDYVNWHLILQSKNGHGVDISGTTNKTQIEWHYNVGIADRTADSYLETTLSHNDSIMTYKWFSDHTQYNCHCWNCCGSIESFTD